MKTRNHITNDKIILELISLLAIERLNPRPLLKVDTKNGLLLRRVGKKKYKACGYRKSDGYYQFCWSYDGQRYGLALHRIIRLYYELIEGGKPTYQQGFTIDHINSNKGDNRVKNILFTSHKLNVRKDTPTRKYKLIPQSTIDKARKMYKTGRYSQQDVADLCGISPRHLFDILHNTARNGKPKVPPKQVKYTKPLTFKKAKAIYNLLKKGWFQVDIAKKFKVKHQTISRIKATKSFYGVKL